MNLHRLYTSSLFIFMCLFISVIRQDKFCENASNYVYWYASTGCCNKAERKGYHEVGY